MIDGGDKFPDARVGRIEPQDFNPEMVYWFNRLTKEEILQAMEELPTDVLEWAVGFEAMAHRSTGEG